MIDSKNLWRESPQYLGPNRCGYVGTGGCKGQGCRGERVQGSGAVRLVNRPGMETWATVLQNNRK